MIPTTYPSFLNPFSDQAECKVSYLSSVSGLTAWTDYIPVQTVVYSGNVEGRTEANGYQAVHPVGATGNVAWTDYVPVYEDATKTVAWSTDANGYIPIGMSEDGVLAFIETAEFGVELTHTAVPTAAAVGTTATFTRATTKTVENNDGYLVTLLAGEIGFPGARRVLNVLQGMSPAVKSEDITTFPYRASASVTTPTVDTIAWTPDVYTNSGVATQVGYVPAAGVVNRTFCFSATVWVDSGTYGAQLAIIQNGVGNYYQAFTATTTPTRVQFVKTFGASATGVMAGFYNGVAGGAGTIRVTDMQLEDVTAQTTQTAGEYVSVGVESAPYYHGSFVDGVKCFPTDLAGNALPTSYTYDAVSLNGVAGTYVSTPDSVAASVTGDLTLEWIGSLSSYAVINTLISKWNVASYLLRISATKKVLFDANGTNSVGITSTASVPFNDGDDNVGVKVVVDADNGAGGSTTSIYTTIDAGENWTLLQAATVTAGVLVIADTNDAVMIGNYGVSSGLQAGKTYTAKIYSGSTLAVDFDASRYAGGTTLTGSTGETWTLQGNAVIHPTNSPMLGYNAEGARTNLCLQSNAFTTTWTPSGLTPTQNVTGPDGATSAWNFTDSNAGAAAFLYQSINLTAAAHSFSFFVKKTTGAQSSYPVVYATDSVNAIAAATIDTSNGIATIWTAFTGFASPQGTASCVIFNDDFWRVTITFTASAVPWAVLFAPAGTTNPTQSTGAIDVTAQGSAVFYGAQVELGSFASSYIPTTTAAVTRNADVLTYSGGDVPNLKTVMAGFRRESGVSSVGYLLAKTDGTTADYEAIGLFNASNLHFEGVDNSVLQWDASSNTYVADTEALAAWSAQTNDIKFSLDGATLTADTSASVPTTTELDVGHVAGTAQPFANVGPVYGWTRNQSQSELNAVTA